MNVITHLQTEIIAGGRLNNGRISQRVFVGGEFGGAWYELSLSNDRANQRDITARREDCLTAQPVTAQNAATWLERLRDQKDRQLEARNVIAFVPAVQPLEVGA